MLSSYQAAVTAATLVAGGLDPGQQADDGS
jgi:hypothetical protein